MVVVVGWVVVVVGSVVVVCGVGTIPLTIGDATLIVDVPLMFPDEAVMVTLPSLRPRTTPDGETDAALDDDLHVIVRPRSTLPLLSKTWAISLSESPWGRFAVEGETVSERPC